MPTNEIHMAPDNAARSLCWSCKQEIGVGPFCKHCVKIQPVDELGHYFSLFGLPKTYDVEPADLKKTFFALSRRFHPDFYSGQSRQEQKLARDNTAYLNNALRILFDPIERAEYLLSLVAGTFSSSPAPPQDLFEEILVTGELLEKGDLSDGDRRLLAEAAASFRKRQQELTDSLKGLFEKLMKGDDTIKDQVVSRLDRMKYLRNILNRIDARLGKEGQNG